MEENFELLTDLYQLTMAQGYFASGKLKQQACFHAYFRDWPFNGGYAIACGTAQLAELVKGFSFGKDDIEYLASLNAPQGGKLFSEQFLDYLKAFELCVNIDAVSEGSVVFPNEPLLRVTGSILQCQLLETALLNCINFQTLIATKASRICCAAGKRPVAEFGLRRAQGPCGGVWASRAAIVGGCASTSNVLAGKMFDVPVSGTHAHSWVMSFDTELNAFREYAHQFPKNCVLLVDTYNVEEGVKNAITVAKEMQQRGERLAGIRIDSGDLAWLSKKARQMLDDAGLLDCSIVLSNDLDEFTIRSLIDQGAAVNSFGVGTKLACADGQPTLGGVYKLSATKQSTGTVWGDILKVSGASSKLTFPGVLDIRRYVFDDGKIAGDMVFDVNHEVNNDEIAVDPADPLRQKKLSGLKHHTLLKPLARNGRVVLKPNDLGALMAQQRAKLGLDSLDESQKRLLKPHTYPVGLERGLHKRRLDLAKKLRGAND